jgi:transmembrane sensor
VSESVFPSDGRSARLEEAAIWRVRIEACENLMQSEDFLAWFAEPLNREAYERACSTWNAFEDHQAAPELIVIRRDALHRARAASLQRIVPRSRRWHAFAAMPVLGLFASVAVWQLWLAPTEYVTGIGARQVVTLEDGSRISLDSDTAVQVAYTRAARQLVLERGRARFDVTHNVARPFTVRAGNETVVAVGTSFDVERLGQKVLVTLIEGHVVVKSAEGIVQPAESIMKSAARAVARVEAIAPKPVALAAGQELVASVDMKPAIVPTSLPVATAWESGRLILDNEPLAEAVERVNRYTDKPLIVDPAVASVRVSGVFNAGDVGAFIDAITSYFPVQASVSADNQIVLEKRS